MRVVFLENNESGFRVVKEFNVKDELEIKLPDIGKIKVRKLIPTIQINDDYIVTKRYSVKIGNNVVTGGKYDVLRKLLDKKARNIPVEVVDTLYYDTPSSATVIVEVYDNEKLVSIISYYKESDDVLKIIVRFVSNHFIKNMWIYEITNSKNQTPKN